MLCHLIHKVKDGSEVRRPVQINALDRVLVCIDHAVEPIALRVENVTVQSEAVLCLRDSGGNCGAETENWNLLVCVVVLKNVADRHNGV